MTSLCACTDRPRISPGCLCHARADAIRLLTGIRHTLTGTYTPAGINIWMHAANANLGGRSPMAAVMAGDGRDVLTEAERVASS